MFPFFLPHFRENGEAGRLAGGGKAKNVKERTSKYALLHFDSASLTKSWKPNACETGLVSKSGRRKFVSWDT